jgi:energy-coupling factor transporter ATP-binding protein EcfA2
MPGPYECNVPLLGGNLLMLPLEPGRSIIVVGANGSGKTRLGVFLENQLPPNAVHRIAAQKSLSLSDSISIISLDMATKMLRYGHQYEALKQNSRWGGRPATHFLTDFDALLQTLFANHNRIALEHLQQRKLTPHIPVPTTKLERLKAIWDGLLPHRALKILDAAIHVCPLLQNSTDIYAGSEMSDGERSIFYFLGQCLVAPEYGVIIIDEPEAHIHKAILEPLWDAIEKERPDCSFIFITHDLDFAVTHTASAKYYLRSYSHSPVGWEIEELPEGTGLPEQAVAELVGSRKPVLFIEGVRGSLDLTVYRSQYAGFTIVPVGSCEAVIHSVASYKGSAALHWLGVCGLVDADDRGAAELAELAASNVYVLPVADVENLLLLPAVFLALAEAFLCSDPKGLLSTMTAEVIKQASSNIDLVSARYTTRQLDRRLKRVTVDARDLSTLQTSYQAELNTIDPTAVFNGFKSRLEKCIQTSDMPGLLEIYDNKGLLAYGASLLGFKGQKYLLDKLGRLLGANEGKKVLEELSKALPKIPC